MFLSDKVCRAHLNEIAITLIYCAVPLVWKYTAALADHNGLFIIENSTSCKFKILLLLNRAQLLSVANGQTNRIL